MGTMLGMATMATMATMGMMEGVTDEGVLVLLRKVAGAAVDVDDPLLPEDGAVEADVHAGLRVTRHPVLPSIAPPLPSWANNLRAGSTSSKQDSLTGK